MEETKSEINTINDSLVTIGAENIAVMRLRPLMSKPEALRLAAWLVAMADDKDEFPALLDAVRST